MIIRAFEPGDRDAVIALWRDVFPEYADASRPQRDPALSIANKMKTQPELFFVGLLDGAIAGTVMAGYDGHRGWVYSLAVAMSLRGNGYGSALMQHAERALAKLGCPKVNLQILSVKTELRGFYEKLGYRMDEVVSLGKRL
ncbi:MULTISPECIES: GNAT family acetyltransferase [Caballeronia]|uniref:GNAT family acetyltransferase n=1 Tax=Caballeronia TaxID=1827195 RepID=UPI0002389026|nr:MULTISPECIES: GNAT family acetyltransferase [unclassified Caballeronia]AET88400.1 GCN5-related N-acetyltransferase [Burkholderia sp. YI23]BAO85611.1 GCN5-related N-acetyltransferase [Burkholderia sp. RPE67]BBP95446.1 GNAT family acetyltransferase [Burkholderia sp. SFA1]MCE4542658.1 GNAT family acetyltransferase [Caballeronia sp. PC1]MCE4568286.1 GNAT family acetyltransferase [Caballeronia sp. CLC5]